MSKNLILLLSLSLFSCSHQAVVVSKSEISHPTEAFSTHDKTQITIAVVGINDFHGNLLPKERKLPNESIVASGGASNLAAMIKILRDEMQGRVMIVDAGDEWQGTLESNQAKGATVVQFYRNLGVKVAAIGNHEFDFSLDTMREQISKATYPYVASNIFEKKNHQRVRWKNVFPSRLFEVAGMKIGVIGFSTTQTPSTTRYEFVKHLDFKDPVKPVTEESKKLKKAGADLILVTAHAGTQCEDRLGLRSWGLWNESAPQSKCDPEQEIAKLASELPKNTIDGIVAGHTHTIIHHFFNHIPVIQDEAYDQFFNIIYFTFDQSTKKLIPGLTRIEGLIPICNQVFQNTDHCDVRRLQKDENPKLVQATFHGKQVIPDPETEAWLAPIKASTEKYRKQILTISELPLSHFRDKEGAFGNLIADVLRDSGQTDFSLVNSGGVRTPLDAGPITADGLFRALPFDNLLNVIKVSGAQVKLLYRIASAGSHGIISFSGLRLTLIPYDREVERDDLNGDGKLENWEGKRLVKIETSDGSPIEDDKMYTVATFDFLVNGGDDLHWFMSQLSEKNILRKKTRYCRELISDYLNRFPLINTREHPLVDPKNPRVIFTP